MKSIDDLLNELSKNEKVLNSDWNAGYHAAIYDVKALLEDLIEELDSIIGGIIIGDVDFFLEAHDGENLDKLFSRINEKLDDDDPIINPSYCKQPQLMEFKLIQELQSILGKGD